MLVFRLTKKEEQDLENMARFMNMDPHKLMDRMIKTEMGVLQQSMKEYAECQSACVKVDAAEWLGIEVDLIPQAV